MTINKGPEVKKLFEALMKKREIENSEIQILDSDGDNYICAWAEARDYPCLMNKYYLWAPYTIDEGGKITGTEESGEREEILCFLKCQIEEILKTNKYRL